MDGVPWRMADQDADRARALADAAGVPDPLGQVLLNRGIRSAVEADRFLRPRLSGLEDPFALPGMGPAADRLVRAAREGQRIVIFGDYDVDGVTATALLAHVLRRLGAQIRTFLPDRVRDGYGLSPASLKRCLAGGPVDLVLTVDCGTNACSAARAARDDGVDLLISDHHQPSEPVPEAVSVVNPRYASPDRPWFTLAGVGVAFKIAHAVLKQGRAEALPGADALDLRTLLDGVALGTVADAVPLQGENRILVRYGLAVATNAPSPGIEALCRVAGTRAPLEAWHMGFALGPRLNAAGRMASADDALALLLSTDADQAQACAQRLDRLNRERQRMESRVLESALEQSRTQGSADDWTGRVAAGQDWHPGVIGIVAARISMTFRQPAIVFALRADGGGRGSGRGPDGFNLIEALADCAEHLDRFGGHSAAVGLDLKPGRIEAFRTAFSEAVQRKGVPSDGVGMVADAVLGLGEADDRLIEALAAFRPFGQGNPAPVWMQRGVQVLESRAVGGGRHRNFRLAEGGVERSGIGFNLGERGAPPPRIDILYEVQRNTFAGRTSVQLKIRDWRDA